MNHPELFAEPVDSLFHFLDGFGRRLTLSAHVVSQFLLINPRDTLKACQGESLSYSKRNEAAGTG